jgi:hypothetical protein
MERSTFPLAAVVVLAWLVVLAPTAVAGGPVVAGSTGSAVTESADRGLATLDGPPVPTNNTSSRLVLADHRIERSAFETVTIGTANTLQAGAYGARTEHRRIAIELEFEAADGVGEKRSVVDRALIDLNSRARALKDRERATLHQYSEGNISTETMVRRLADINARAREFADTLGLVRDLTNRIGTDDFDSRTRGIEGVLNPLRGPVRERVSRSLSGEATSVRVNIVASDEGLVLSTLSGGQYMREATDWNNRNGSAPPELEAGDFGGIVDRVEELYPWVTKQQPNIRVKWLGEDTGFFRANHPQGTLTVTLDVNTADVYREVQWLNVEQMASTMTTVHTRNGLRVVLQRTYPGGPLRIFVEDASTDAVVNARVIVDGQSIGLIGADGVVMTLEPRVPYTVNVTDSDSSVVIDVDRPLNGSG